MHQLAWGSGNVYEQNSYYVRLIVMTGFEDTGNWPYDQADDPYSLPQETSTPTPVLRRSVYAKAVGLAVVAGLALGLLKVSSDIEDLKKDFDHQGDQVDQINDRANQANQRSDRLAGELAQYWGLDANEVLGDNLKQPSELPGYGRQVSSPQEKKLQQSSVVIMERPKGTSEPWFVSCSGEKIAAGKSTYIMTASHCLNYGAYPKSDAANVTAADPYEYAISKPTTNKHDRSYREPIAKVTDEAVMGVQGEEDEGNSPDIALLRVKPLPGDKSNPYQEMSALSIERQQKPVEGEEATLYSFPSSVGHVAVSARGTYLGESTSEWGLHNQYTNYYQEIGLDVEDAKKAPFMSGGSGSFGISASGYVFGPFSGTSTVSSSVANQPRDDYGYDYADHDTSRKELASRLQEEQALGLDLSPYTIVGSMTLRPNGSLENLIKGLNHPVVASHQPSSVK